MLAGEEKLNVSTQVNGYCVGLPLVLCCPGLLRNGEKQPQSYPGSASHRAYVYTATYLHATSTSDAYRHACSNRHLPYGCTGADSGASKACTDRGADGGAIVADSSACADRADQSFPGQAGMAV